MKRSIALSVGVAAMIAWGAVVVWWLSRGPTPATGPAFTSGVIPDPEGISSWYPGFALDFDGRRYAVSTSHVSGAGSYLGDVSYHGSHSGVFALYAIPNIPNHEAIAVRTRSGYLLAVENRRS